MQSLFIIISTLALLMALGTVLAKNLVHAGLFLVAFFFLIACQFVLLEAEFLAAVQVLVNIGAVSIILMFGIMLTRNIQGDETTGGRWTRKIPAAIIGIGLLVVLVLGIVDEKGIGGRGKGWTDRDVARPVFIPPEPGAKLDTAGADEQRSAAIADMGRYVGIEMLQRFVIPFEVAGLLLTAALVGAIALAQSDEKDREAMTGSALAQSETAPNPRANGQGAAIPSVPPVGARHSPKNETL